MKIKTALKFENVRSQYKEAMRVVNTLPAFKPGKQGGKPVPVWYMVPITFTLK